MKSFLKKSALCSASCLQALSITGLAVGAIAISAPAAAQDYTAGAVTGTVTDQAGKAVPGATVTLSDPSTGISRTTTSSSSGAFRFAAVPIGTYTVQVSSANTPNFTATDVHVLAGQTAGLNIALPEGGNEIVVTAASIQQPFTGTTSGVNVDVADLVKQAPINRDLTSVILLAPGTTKGDNQFGNLASIGGSSVAENAYYVNGLNTTNFDNYLGSAQVPFEFYRNVEVKSGGYPAEFGRATGGIVNAVTKSGSNEYMVGAHLNWEPDWARSDGKNRQYCDNAGCYPLTMRSEDKNDKISAIIEAGGPIIEDRLFVYGLVEMHKDTSRVLDLAAKTAYNYKNTDPFWGVKVDAYPIQSQHLEFTIWDTRNTTFRSDQPIAVAGNKVTYGIASGVTAFKGGGVDFVGKWTGHMTDFLTLSAAYGRMRDRFDNPGVAGAAGLFMFYNGSGNSVQGVPNGGYFNGQRVQTVELPYSTQRKFFRADADLFFTAFGDHHVRGGYDLENNLLKHTSVRTGNGVLCTNGFLTAEACNANFGGAGLYVALRSPWSPAAQALVDAGATTKITTACATTADCRTRVELNYYNAGGTFKARNQAFYLEDEWDITDRLTLNLGVRRDDFKVDKADGSTLVNLDKNYAPRIGLTYDLWPDKSGKFKAFWGRYFLPVASNTAYRQASPEIYFRELYYFNGIDANGLPIISAANQIAGYPAYASACPIKLTPVSSGGNCSVTGDGTVPDTGAAISHNLKATRETEWILGYEHKLAGWTFGLTYTHRNLDISAEDMAIDAAVNKWCAANGIAGCSKTWTGYNQYVITNPGHDVVVNLRGLDGREVTFKAADLGYPKAKRTYDAVEFTFDKPFNGKWGLKGSYTWSKSKGNSEGFVQSDFGQDDAGITQDFDQPGFLDGAYGYLPNDRRHRISLWGSYAITDAFLIGTTIRVQSPRSLSCFGYYPRSAANPDPYENGYGAASHYCGLKLSPRGTAQRTDWEKQVDLAARYNLEMWPGQTVTFRVDVFNVFNSQAVTKRNEIGEIGYNNPNPNYHLPTAYQTPRYVRFGLDFSFGGARQAPPPPVAAPAPVEEPVAAPPPPPPAPEPAPPPPPAPQPTGERG